MVSLQEEYIWKKKVSPKHEAASNDEHNHLQKRI